jgi:hypothetical protein
MVTKTKRHLELVTERTVERFMRRLFLREIPLRGLYIVAPFISALSDTRFSLMNLRKKIENERFPVYIVTRDPIEPYQQEAMAILRNCPWIEIRYNPSIHAKVYVATAKKDGESFALFGSGNLTAKSIESNIEVAMLIYSEGPGREILHELHYWASVRLRTLKESRLIKPIKIRR